jgi:hypothetical protein
LGHVSIAATAVISFEHAVVGSFDQAATTVVGYSFNRVIVAGCFFNRPTVVGCFFDRSTAAHSFD